MGAGRGGGRKGKGTGRGVGGVGNGSRARRVSAEAAEAAGKAAGKAAAAEAAVAAVLAALLLDLLAVEALVPELAAHGVGEHVERVRDDLELLARLLLVRLADVVLARARPALDDAEHLVQVGRAAR